jgi:hypothetical protein
VCDVSQRPVTVFIVATAEDVALTYERGFQHADAIGPSEWVGFESLVRANRVAKRYPGAVVVAVWPIWQDEPAREVEQGDLLQEAS